MEKDTVTETNSNPDVFKEKLTKLIKDAPYEQEIENLQNWYSNYINCFREEFKKLNEDEKKCVSNAKNFLKPCQIEIFWISNPSYQLIVLSNHSNRKDKEIFVHGPYSTHSFMEKIGLVLHEDRFQSKIEREHVFDSFSQPETYAEQLAQRLHEFIKNFKNQLFQPKIIEDYSMRIAMNNSWLQEFQGDITHLDYEKEVQSTITAIKQEAKIRIDSQTNIVPTPVNVSNSEKYDGFGVHFFPPLTIGKKSKRTLEQHLHGNDFHFSYLDKILDTQFGNNLVIVNKNGYLFIEAKQKLEALKILNLIMALGYFHKLPLFAVKEHELSQASYNKETKDIKTIIWGMGSIRSYLFTERFEKHTVEIHEKRNIEKTKLEEILTDAKIIMNVEKLSEELRLFNEANTHLRNSEYAQSFIMSWSVIERHFSDIWRTKLDQKDVDEERLGKLTNSAQWTIDFVLEVLNLGNEIDDNTYDLLMELKRKRNRFYHRGKQVAKEDAERCLILAKQLLDSKILEVKPSSIISNHESF